MMLHPVEQDVQIELGFLEKPRPHFEPEILSRSGRRPGRKIHGIEV